MTLLAYRVFLFCFPCAFNLYLNITSKVAGAKPPVGEGGSPFAPLVYIFSTKKFGFVWGRGYISLPRSPTRYLYICHIPYPRLVSLIFVCHTCSSYLSHLTRSTYLFLLPLNFSLALITYPVRLPYLSSI